jgi:hypothetical protein
MRTNTARDEGSALDRIEHTLYDPKGKVEDIHLHHVRDRKNTELPTSWGDNTPLIIQAKEDHGASFGFKFLIASIILLVLALTFTGWRVFSLRNVVSSANIDLTGDIAPTVEGGADTPLTVTLFNRNTTALQEASLTLMYKKGVGAQDEQEKVQEKVDIGNINPNKYKHQEFKVVLFGAEAESRDLTIKLEYKVAGSNAVFSKVVDVTTVLKTPPISVRIDGPTTLSVGQNGSFTITVKNNSATTSIPSLLQLTLPTTFTLTEESPTSIAKGPTWTIDPLAPGESKKISLSGVFLGTQGETLTMRAIVGSQNGRSSTVGVVFSSETTNIKLRSSPLVITTTLETDTGVPDVIRYGDNAVVTLTYTNVSDFTLKNVSLALHVAGDAALYKLIKPENEGLYDSPKQTITWSPSTNPELANVPPGGTQTFRVLIPVVTKGNNSPALKLELVGSGTDNTSEDVVATLSKTWIVQGSATISAQTRYKNSDFANSGPIPPTPNTETTYTAHLTVSAQNTLVNTLVVFTLPAYVSWENTFSENAQVSYDSKSRTVTWNIGGLDAGKSVSTDIMLGVKPSQSHVGSSPSITSPIILDADEQDSKAHIRTTISQLSTRLAGETWTEDPSKVVDH